MNRSKWLNLNLMQILIFSTAANLAMSAQVEVKHPCAPIESACLSNGFHKQRHKAGNGVWKDCMEPIMNGKSVPGLSINQRDIQGCLAARAHSKKK